MDREKTHRKIDELATLISVNNNRMLLHEERIPQLDIDLLRKNAIELYEAINMLHIQNLKDKRQAKLMEESVETEEPVEEIVEVVEKVEETVIEEPASEEEEPEEVVAEEEPIVEEQPKEVKKEEPKVVAEEKVVEEKKPEPAPKKETKSSGKKVDLYEKLNRSSIESIKRSISISKRYEVQASLFKNDPDAYNDAISRLDNCNNVDEALSILNDELKNSYNWDDEDPLFEELLVLVERRYS